MTTLVVAGVTASAAWLALALIAVFLAHEPLVVLLGYRGQRAQRERAAIARVWFGAMGGAALVTGAIAVFSWPASQQWSLLVPLAPAIPAVWAVVAGREKTWLAEIAVSLAFSGATFPLGLAAGASTATAATIAIVYAANFALATLAVRVVILKVRAGGNPGAAASMRRTTLFAAGAALIGVTAGCLARLLPWTALVALSPGVVVSLGLALQPPPAVKLRVVGWTLVVTLFVTAGVLIAGL